MERESERENGGKEWRKQSRGRVEERKRWIKVEERCGGDKMWKIESCGGEKWRK